MTFRATVDNDLRPMLRNNVLPVITYYVLYLRIYVPRTQADNDLRPMLRNNFLHAINKPSAVVNLSNYLGRVNKIVAKVIWCR